jgi:hypothetical protein
MQALDSRMAYFVINYVVPNATESLLSLVTNALIGAEILEYLPVPTQSFEGSCPFNQNQGIGKHESVFRRTTMAAPLLSFSYWMVRMTSMGGIEDCMRQLLQPGQFTEIDERAQWLQCFRFLVEGSLIYAIWLIESNRCANVMTFAQLPTIFCILGLGFGPDFISPCYYALHFVFSSVEKFAAADARLTNVAYIWTILLLVLLFIGAPVLLALTGYSVSLDKAWRRWQWMLQPPFTIAIIQWIMVKTQVSKVSMHENAMGNQMRDLPYIRLCLCVLSAMSAATWISATLQSALSDAFSPALLHGAHRDLLELNRHGTLL